MTEYPHPSRVTVSGGKYMVTGLQPKAMTSTRESYQDGQSLGYEYADEDRRQHAGFAAEESELRAQAREARTDDTSASWRAFKLGIVRAYRDATRTLRGGRWGT